MTSEKQIKVIGTTKDGLRVTPIYFFGKDFNVDKDQLTDLFVSNNIFKVQNVDKSLKNDIDELHKFLSDEKEITKVKLDNIIEKIYQNKLLDKKYCMYECKIKFIENNKNKYRLSDFKRI